MSLDRELQEVTERLPPERRLDGRVRVLMELAGVLHERRIRELEEATAALVKALDRVYEARDACEASGETLLEAARTLARIRDAS